MIKKAGDIPKDLIESVKENLTIIIDLDQNTTFDSGSCPTSCKTINHKRKTNNELRTAASHSGNL